MIKECKIHGKVKHIWKSWDSRYRCSPCASDAVAKSRRRAKELLTTEFGGKCIRCKYDECLAGLVFHHIDPATKKFEIGSGAVHSREKMREEAKKCILLCQNCHSSFHYGAWSFEDLGV